VSDFSGITVANDCFWAQIAQGDPLLEEPVMKENVVTRTSPLQAVQTGTAPNASNNVAKPGAPLTVGGEQLKNKTVAPTSLNRSAQANTKPTASNKVARPDAANPLLEKRERTGVKVIVQRAGTTASVPQAVKFSIALPGVEQSR
jgi:hypothetical protein